GATYKVAPGMSIYAGYSQANRTPTPLELGCSNPQRPCLIESALVSDPPLKQVVANTYEAGWRGQLPVNGGVVEWKLGAFRTDASNDIVHLASFLQGRGFFANVPATRREGIEAGVEYRSPTWLPTSNNRFATSPTRC